jgi:hypothetical protein
MYESLFSPIVFRAERSSLRFSSGGIPNRKTARLMTATTPARAVKKVEAAMVRWQVGVEYSTGWCRLFDWFQRNEDGDREDF